MQRKDDRARVRIDKKLRRIEAIPAAGAFPEREP
jgi:hypothetical protein